MKLKDLYREAIKSGIDADIRSKKEIESILGAKKKEYEALSKKKKELFDLDFLFNPFADTRILAGDPESKISSLIVGIDVDGAELLLVDRLKKQGKNIDLAVAHHPQGRAFASFYDVMDLQVDIVAAQGVSLGAAQNLLGERKNQVERRVSSANHQRSVDIANLLGINFLCLHTPCDNFANQHIHRLMDKEKPRSLGQIVDLLCAIPEYNDAAKNNNPPKIVVGNKKSRCQRIHLEFTGGTEGSKKIYDKLASCGIDTIIAMHQSEEHFNRCKQANINVIFASHIASDSIGINLLLDRLERKGKLKIYEFSGFRRFPRKNRR